MKNYHNGYLVSLQALLVSLQALCNTGLEIIPPFLSGRLPYWYSKGRSMADIMVVENFGP